MVMTIYRRPTTSYVSLLQDIHIVIVLHMILWKNTAGVYCDCNLKFSCKPQPLYLLNNYIDYFKRYN